MIAEITTYADYVEFSERLREAQFTEGSGDMPSHADGITAASRFMYCLLDTIS
jgi:hypothetical protein